MAATDKALGDLHAMVAQTLAEDLAAAERIEDPVLRAVARKDARAQAITFLKNNSITADVEQDQGLRELSERLNRKRQASKQALQEAAQQFAERNGDLLQ